MAATEPRSASELVSLLLELARVVKARRYFEPGDARLPPLFEHARRVWVADLARYGPLELIVQADHIVQGDQSVAIDGRLAATLDDWRTRGLGRLSVEPDIDGDAFAGLVEILAMPEQNLHAEGGAGTALARRVPFGLVIEPFEAEADQDKDPADTDVLALRSAPVAESESRSAEAVTDSATRETEAAAPPAALSRHAAHHLVPDPSAGAEDEHNHEASIDGEPGRGDARPEPAVDPAGTAAMDPERIAPRGSTNATDSEPTPKPRGRSASPEERLRPLGRPEPKTTAPTARGATSSAEAPAPLGGALPEASRDIPSEGSLGPLITAEAPAIPTTKPVTASPMRAEEPAVASLESQTDRAPHARGPGSDPQLADDPDTSSKDKIETDLTGSVQDDADPNAGSSATGLPDGELEQDDPSEATPALPLDTADLNDKHDRLARHPDESSPAPDLEPADDEEDTDVVALRTPSDAIEPVEPEFALWDADPPSGLSDTAKLRWPKRMLKAAAHRSRALADRARGADDETAELADSRGPVTGDANAITAPSHGKGFAGRLLAGLRSGSDTEPLHGDGTTGRGIADEDTLPVGNPTRSGAEPFLNPSDAAATMLRELENASDPATYAELTDSLVRLVEAESTSLGTAATLRILSSLAVECDAKRGESQRVTAETAIRRLALGEVQDALFDQASDGGSFGEGAGRILQQLGPDVVSPLIDYALTEPEPERFAHLAEQFGNLEPSHTTAPVLAALGRSERQEVLRAIRLAERHPRLETTGRMADLLRSEDEFIREGAARALARRASPEGGDDPQALRGLARGLQSTDPTLTALCAECLSATGSPRAVPPLTTSLHAAVEARDLDTARERIRALGELGRGEAAGELGSLLLTRDWLGRKRLRELKLAACQALGRLPGDEAVGVLSQAAQLRDAQLREAAQTALDRRMTGRDQE